MGTPVSPGDRPTKIMGAGGSQGLRIRMTGICRHSFVAYPTSDYYQCLFVWFGGTELRFENSLIYSDAQADQRG